MTSLLLIYLLILLYYITKTLGLDWKELIHFISTKKCNWIIRYRELIKMFHFFTFCRPCRHSVSSHSNIFQTFQFWKEHLLNFQTAAVRFSSFIDISVTFSHINGMAMFLKKCMWKIYEIISSHLLNTIDFRFF